MNVTGKEDRIKNIKIKILDILFTVSQIEVLKKIWALTLTYNIKCNMI